MNRLCTKNGWGEREEEPVRGKALGKGKNTRDPVTKKGKFGTGCHRRKGPGFKYDNNLRSGSTLNDQLEEGYTRTEGLLWQKIHGVSGKERCFRWGDCRQKVRAAGEGVSNCSLGEGG